MSELNEVTTKCERCGTPIIVVHWDGGSQWMEQLGWSMSSDGEVWGTHTPENCAAARARAEARL